MLVVDVTFCYVIVIYVFKKNFNTIFCVNGFIVILLLPLILIEQHLFSLEIFVYDGRFAGWKDKWWLIIFEVWLTEIRRLALFPAEPLSEILTTANLWHAASRILSLCRTWDQALLNKVCSSGNHYTTPLFGCNGKFWDMIFNF